jgi:dTDP-4-dehydrorhamnose reductase
MNILLLGANGQVGWELQRALAPLGTVHAHDRRTADLSQPQSLHALIFALRPTVIVNAGAYTAVDKAESEVELAHAINAQAPAALAKAALAVGALLVHYSTDYVFDGTKVGAYLPQDATAPQSVYGASKLAGEQAIAASGCAYLIFRTSWVYAARGGNFAKTMLKLAQTREALSVVADQIGAPTGADLIADVSAHCIAATLKDPALAGLYHLVAGGETSCVASGPIAWRGFESGA